MDYVQILSFEKCSHCADVYYLFIHFRNGQSSSVQCYGVCDKQNAFNLLNQLHKAFFQQLDESQFEQAGQDIACSSLPEYEPVGAAKKMLADKHCSEEAKDSLKKSIMAFHQLIHHNPISADG